MSRGILIVGSGGVGRICHSVAESMPIILIENEQSQNQKLSAPEPLIFQNPYRIETLFSPPLRRRERRKLNRKK